MQLLSSTKEKTLSLEGIKEYLKSNYADDYYEIIDEDSDYDFGRQLSADFITRTGLKSTPQALLNGIPLPSSQLTIDDFEELILHQVMSQTSSFQKAVFHGKLSDKDDVVDHIMSQPNVMPRLNQRILSKENNVFLEVTGKAAVSLVNLEKLVKLSGRDMTATAIANLKYFVVERKAGTKYHAMTYWVIGDLKCGRSRELLKSALEHLVSRCIFLTSLFNRVDRMFLLPPKKPLL